MKFSNAIPVKVEPQRRPGRLRATMWAVLVCAGVWGAAAQAEESNLLDLSLQELVDYRLTSMSRKEQRVVDTAAAAYVITGEELRRSGALSIPEALRMVPGLNVAQISRDNWAVSSRGFLERFSSKLLVLVMAAAFTRPCFLGCCGKPKTP